MATASGIRAGRAYVEMGSNQTELEKGLRSAEAKVKAFGKSVAEIGAKLSAVGVGIVTPLLGAAKQFADAGSELNDMATRTGVSVEALSALGYAAKQSGSDMGAVEIAIKKMQKALLAGSEENMAAAGTFASLGLSIEQLSRLNPEEQFRVIAKTIGSIPNPTARAGAALQVFGKSGTALLPMIEDLDQLTQEAKAFGLVWTGEEAKKADALGDALDLLRDVLGRVVTAIGGELAPLLTDIAVAMARAAKSAIDFAKANGPLIVSVLKVGAGIVAAGAAFITLGGAIVGIGAVLGTIASGIGAIVAGFTALISPIGLVVVGLTGLTAWFLTSTTAGVQAVGFLGDAFKGLAKTARDAFKGIGDALKAGDIALAGQILWAGLKVEFLKGVNFLKGLWADWGTATIEVFRGISFRISGIFIDAWANIQSGLAIAVAGMQNAFTGFIGWLSKSWTSFGGFFATVWERIKSLFGAGDVEAEIKRINDEVAASNAAQDRATTETIGKRREALRGQLGGIEAERTGARGALKSQEDIEVEARRKKAQEGLAGGAAELEAAKKSLADLLGQAGKEAAGVGVPEMKKGKRIGEFTPEGLGEALAATKAKIDVAGSFAAKTLPGLGAGKSVQDEQLKEQRKTNDQLAKLNNKARVGALVFN